MIERYQGMSKVELMAKLASVVGTLSGSLDRREEAVLDDPASYVQEMYGLWGEDRARVRRLERDIIEAEKRGADKALRELHRLERAGLWVEGPDGAAKFADAIQSGEVTLP